MKKLAEVKKKCAVCSAEFVCKTTYDRKQKKVCSRACRDVWNTQRHADSRVEWACENCDKKEDVLPHVAATKRFCGYSCSNSFLRKHENNRRENNPAWAGGHARARKKEARRRDDFTCQFPGCGVRNVGRGTHAHHKLPVRAGGTHTPENLITFCRKHHRTVEALLVRAFCQKHPRLVGKLVGEMYGDLELALDRYGNPDDFSAKD